MCCRTEAASLALPALGQSFPSTVPYLEGPPSPLIRLQCCWGGGAGEVTGSGVENRGFCQVPSGEKALIGRKVGVAGCQR